MFSGPPRAPDRVNHARDNISILSSSAYLFPLRLTGAMEAPVPVDAQTHAAQDGEAAATEVQRRGRSTERSEKPRRRVRGKQPPTAHLSRVHRTTEEQATTWVDAAIAAETDDVADLRKGIKRQCIHWTHVRTFNPAWVQPEQVSKKDFWLHLVKIYKEAYPVEKSPTGSVLAFGLICEERHAASLDVAQREVHRHAPTNATEQVYWNKMAKLSLDKYKWPLNAKAHEGYHSMFAYVRDATVKKPLHELDQDPYWSPLHPKGRKLADYLEESAKLIHSRRGKTKAKDEQASTKQKRERVPSLYETIRDHSLRSVRQLQAHAFAEALDGRVALAEYCTKNGGKLEEIIAHAWGVQEAQQKLAASAQTLPQKLEAATHTECTCADCWASGAHATLERNAITPASFCAAVRRALDLGALRGVNIACVGEQGCGKSSVIEPLEKIFDCFPKPQKGSSFGLANIFNKDVVMWQDYLHDEATISFADLLALCVGESVGVRVVGGNRSYRNKAPVFYSGATLMRCGFRDRSLGDRLDGMMDDRFTCFRFNVPVPRETRRPDWPQCGRCAATFYLGTHDEPEFPLLVNDMRSSSSSSQTSPGAQALVNALDRLQKLFREGALDEDEYRAAKRRVING
jgi:hypothetical protein